MDIDDFSSSAVSGVKRKPGKLAGAGLLSPAEQAGSDAMESRPGVADELKNAIAKASPAQRAILTDPKQNGTGILSKPTYKPAIDDLSSAGMSTPPQPTPQPAPQPAPQTVAQLTARPSLGVADDVSNFAMRSGANLGNSAYGGLRGLATLMTGGGIDAAVEDSKQSPIPVVAPNSRTAMLEKGMGKVQSVLDSAGDRAQLGTEATGAAGSGVMGAISKAGISNLPMLLGVGPRTAKTTAMLDEAPAVGKGATAAPGAPMQATAQAPMQATATPAIASKAAPVAGNSAAPSGAPALTPGEVPTLAHASPEMQKAIADSGLPADHPAIARFVNADTLPIPQKKTRGQAMQDGQMISDEMNSRGKGQAAPVSPEFYKEQGQGIAQNIDSIRASGAPDIPATADHIDHGQTLITAYKTKDAAASADVTARYKALTDANGGTLPMDGQTFAANTEAALSKQLKTGSVPADLQSALNEFKNGRQMTFEDFETLRSDAADAMRTSTDGRAKAAAGIIREQLENMPLTPQAAELKPLADSARGAAKARFDAIEADPAYKASVNDPTPLGHPSPAADKFFNSFVRDGKRENVARMRETLQDSPEATQTIAAGILDHLKGQMNAKPATGNFSSANYTKAFDALKPKMSQYVDATTAQQLNSLGEHARDIQAQPRGSFVSTANTAPALIAEAMKSAATHGGNMIFHGVPVVSAARAVGSRLLDSRNAAKDARQSTDPGAALSSLSKLMKP